MVRIFVDKGDCSEVDEICWENLNGGVESIYNDSIEVPSKAVTITDSGGNSTIIYKQDLHKLKAAIDKAIELGWDK